MQICLRIYQRAHHCAVRLFNLADHPVDSDIALPLLRRDLLILLQSVQEPAVALSLPLVFRGQCLEVLLQVPEALFQRIEAVTDHLQGSRRRQLLQHAPDLSVGILHCFQIGCGHFHAVIAQDPDCPAVLLRKPHAETLQDIVHIGEGLLDAVSQIASGHGHQLLVALLCLLVIRLQHSALIIDGLKRGVSPAFREYAQHVRRQPGHLIRYGAGLTVIIILLHGHGIFREVLIRQLALRQLQRLYQFLHGRRVDGKAAPEQLHVHLRRHAQPYLLQLPSGHDVPYAGLPDLAAMIIFRDSRRFLVQILRHLSQRGMHRALPLRHRRCGCFPETLHRHGELQLFQHGHLFQIVPRDGQSHIQQPCRVVPALLIHLAAGLLYDPVYLFRKPLALRSPRALGIVSVYILRIEFRRAGGLSRTAALGQIKIPYLRLQLIVNEIAAGAVPHGLQLGIHLPCLGNRRQMLLGQGHVRRPEAVHNDPCQCLAPQRRRQGIHVQIVRIAYDIFAGTHQLRLDLIHNGHHVLGIHAAGIKALLLHLGIVLRAHGM